MPNAGVLILPSSAVYFPARQGTRCICQHQLIRRKHYKLLRRRKKKSLLQSTWSPCCRHGFCYCRQLELLCPQFSPFSCPSVEHRESLQTLPGATLPPTAQGEGLSFCLSFSSPACYITDGELTHSPFMHTQPEQECN